MILAKRETGQVGEAPAGGQGRGLTKREEVRHFKVLYNVGEPHEPESTPSSPC